NILIVSTVDNFIKPKLIGDRLKVHPLLILLAILGGLRLFGILGIVYGPLIVAIFLALLKVYREHLAAGAAVHRVQS
ncbi:MAG: AI-2E family transporter, partial [candidate division Zixibacteria bacterium]|nr:AI-2E family transporter [candidate division Zixibacteria bacterium]